MKGALRGLNLQKLQVILAEKLWEEYCDCKKKPIVQQSITEHPNVHKKETVFLERA